MLHSNRLYGGSPHSNVFLISDSQEVRRLLASEDARQDDIDRFWREKHSEEDGRRRIEDMGLHPERYPPGRLEFLKTMMNMPGFEIKDSPYCRIVERSKSRCGMFPLQNAVYVFVQVTTGRSSGNKGWVCDSHAPGLFP
jgi:hypothetical protein